MTLDDRYRATTYRVFVPDAAPIDVRIGELCARLDVVLATHAAHTWAFITAWNPGSRQIPAEENEARQAELLGILRERGWRCFDGAGIPDRSDWHPETSVLVLGISKDEAVTLGRRFGQNAITTGRHGEAAELVYCRSV
jgi:hypothetical protein